MSWKVIECELTDHLLSFMWPSKSIEMALGVKEIPRLSPARARPALGQHGLHLRTSNLALLLGMACSSAGFVKRKERIFVTKMSIFWARLTQYVIFQGQHSSNQAIYSLFEREQRWHAMCRLWPGVPLIVFLT